MGLITDALGWAVCGLVGGVAAFAGYKGAEKVSEDYAERLLDAAIRTKDGVVEVGKGIGQVAVVGAAASGKAVVDGVKKSLSPAQQAARVYETGAMEREELEVLVVKLGLDVDTECKGLDTLKRRVNKALAEHEEEAKKKGEEHQPLVLKTG